MLPVMKPRMPSAAQVSPWLTRMDDSGIYSNFGPLVTELERAYADFLHVRPEQVVSVSSATLALEGAVKLSLPSTWLVPDFTFPATALAVLEAGKDAVFADVDPATWQLDPDSVAHDPDSTGLLPVLPFGAPVDLGAWASHPHVVLDAAASLGSSSVDLSGLPVTWSVVFSLHATKVLPAGEGGLAVFGSIEAARVFRAWTNFGFAGTRISSVAGTNAKMSEIHAAYALASLASWDEERRDWSSAVRHSDLRTTELGLGSPVQQYLGVQPYWITAFPDRTARELAEAALGQAQIQTRQWWPAALHDMPAFVDIPIGYSTHVCEHLADTVLGLPMFRGLPAESIDFVAEVLSRSQLRGA